MPEQQYGYKAPTHGGDDNSSGAAPEQPKKKPALGKFANKPDINIRDLFWSIMRAYKAKEDIKGELKSFQNDKISLLRVSLSVIQYPDRYSFEDMSPASVAGYTLQMMFDADWNDLFKRLLAETYNRKDGVSPQFLTAIKSICKKEGYRNIVIRNIGEMIVENTDVEAALAYTAELNSKEITAALKKELLIIALEGIDRAQHYAIWALGPLVKEDAELSSAISKLLGDWDDETRRVAASVLKGVKNPEVSEQAKKQLPQETDDEIKKLLEALAKG